MDRSKNNNGKKELHNSYLKNILLGDLNWSIRKQDGCVEEWSPCETLQFMIRWLVESRYPRPVDKSLSEMLTVSIMMSNYEYILTIRLELINGTFLL